MTIRTKVTNAMDSGKVIRFHQFVNRGENGTETVDETVVDYLYRDGGEFPRHARYKIDGDELAECFDRVTTGPKITDLVSNYTVYFEDADDTPVG